MDVTPIFILVAALVIYAVFAILRGRSRVDEAGEEAILERTLHQAEEEEERRHP